MDPVSLAVTVALNVATMALTASQSIEGPRLTDLSVTVADYGTPLHYLEGTRRLELPVFYAEPIHETRRRRKGKSGKYAEYTYTGTFACAGADQEISQWIKVFLDRRLAYDASATVVQDSLNARDYMRLYLGTEDQDPDPRMVAYIEGLEGPDTCPAYLGVAYVMFEGLPLQPFGNRFPQVSGVLATIGTPAFPLVQINDEMPDAWSYSFSKDFSVLLYSSDNEFELIDVETSAVTYTQTPSPPFFDFQGRTAVLNNGDVIAVTGTGTTVYRFPSNGGLSILEGTCSSSLRTISIFADDTGAEHWFASSASVSGKIMADGFEIDIGDFSGISDCLADAFFQDLDGQVWALCRDVGIDNIYIIALGAYGLGENLTVYTLPGFSGSAAGPTQALHYRDETRDQFVFRSGFGFHIFDRATETYTAGVGFSANQRDPWLSHRPQDTTIWLGFYEVSLADLSIVRSENPMDWGVSMSPGVDTIYDPINNALIDGQRRIFYLDRNDVAATTLEAICNRAALASGLEEGDYDFSALNQEIPGYSWTQGSGRDIVEHLLTLYDSDVRMNGFVLEGIKRGGAVEGSGIAKEMFVRGEMDRFSYELKMSSESDLPKRVYATFADINADQQPNTVISQRGGFSVLTQREVSFDLGTLALVPDDAQPLIDRALRRFWTGSLNGTVKLPPNYLEILPGDVRDFAIEEDITVRGRVLRTVIAPNRIMSVTFQRDRAAIGGLRTAPGGAATGRPLQQTISPVESVLFILDVPILTDSHDQTVPFLYVAAGPIKAGTWTGTDVSRSLSGTVDTYDFGWDSVASNEAANWGTIQNAVPETLSTVMDLGTEIIIQSPQGAFTSATEDELLEDPTLNQIVVGNTGRWEVMQYMDAEQFGADDWLFSGLIRGQRGTERFMGTHEVGDYLVLTAGAVHKHDMGIDKVDDTDWYQATTFGLDSTNQDPVELEFEAEANRPLSPVHLEIERDQLTGDIDFSWFRRSRIGGASVDGQDIPLGETSEAYVLRIADGSGGTIRTENLTQASYHYDDYLQIEDFGMIQPSVTVSVTQKSPSLGLESAAAVETG